MRILSSHVKAALLMARDRAEAFGCKGLPIDVELIAREFGVGEIEPRKMNADGYLGRSRDGKLVIRFRHDVCRERARFTIAHEIGHIILARVQGVDITDLAFRSSGGSSAEETAVNRIAAELLMPEGLLRDSMRSRQGSWDLVWQVRRRFSVSTMALIWRILEVPNLPAIFFRIGTPFSTASVLCRTSEKPQVLFGKKIGEEAVRILADAENDDATPLTVFVGDSDTVIPMASCFVGSKRNKECWSIGWQIYD